MKLDQVKLTDNKLDSNGYWDQPLAATSVALSDLDLFDQNGYDLTTLEQHYAVVNDRRPVAHRRHRMAIKQDWFVQEPKVEGAVLNHSLLFERKGYAGQALSQLKDWAKEMPIIYKVIVMRPKWGLDFSMDYADREGNVFEILHWEYDGFNYEEIQERKFKFERKVLGMDFEQAGKDLLKYKDKWHNLEFFEQSDWKCNFFGIPKERFKMVIWD